ncbi:MAG: 1-acyl-sn-glycerol-3-phosphate acyltransferase [Firmicutes bacterium]|nr:1-acyl-sn-glycerol-3-phosphate acyltransferase [Bacillota bacterium]
MLYKFFVFLSKIFINFLFPYKAYGLENIKKAGNSFIVCSNHVSNIDAAFLAVNLKGQIHFLGKSELFKNRFSKFLLKKLGVIPISRGKKDFLAILEAEKILLLNKILGIFIEGKRSRTGDFLRPKSGASLLAYRTGATILPVCITPRFKNLKIFKKTEIVFGEPIFKEDLKIITGSYSEIRNATEFLMRSIKKLRK